jgi:uncharacterized protein YdaU (DUF1376 family)
MENDKPLYQPWNDEEFRGDLWVQRMTPRQRAMYKNLLQQMFFCSSRPRLLDDDDELWLFADAETKEEWLANREIILKKFQANDGLLEHKRVLEDWNRIMNKREELHDKRSAAGRKGGQASAKQRRGKEAKASNTPSKASEVSKKVSEESNMLAAVASSTDNNGIVEGLE